MHRENSPNYHFYALEHLSRMAPILKEYHPDFEGIIARAEDKKKWLVHPDLTTVALGDSTPELRPDVEFPPGDPFCDGIRSFGESPDCYQLRHFSDVGYVIVRSDWAIPAADASMLFAQGGFFKSAIAMLTTSASNGSSMDVRFSQIAANMLIRPKDGRIISRARALTTLSKSTVETIQIYNRMLMATQSDRPK
jgi:hypothetical protein